MQAHRTQSQRGSATLHPVLWIAALAVTAFSVVGIGKQMGWFGPTTTQEPDALVATAPATAAPVVPAVAPAPEPVAVEKPAPKTEAPAVKKPAPAKTTKPVSPPAASNTQKVVTEPVPATPARQICADCGVISAIRPVEVTGEGSGVGAVAGGVVGGVVGNQFGKGSGKTAATVLGAVIGGVSGHKIEENVRTKTRYDVSIRMEDGSTRTISLDQAPMLREGDRVRVNGNQLTELPASGATHL